MFSFSRIPATTVLALSILGGVCIPTGSQASDFDWGNSISFAPTNRIFSADGTAMSAANVDQFHFQIGTFGGFTPSTANYTQWFNNFLSAGEAPVDASTHTFTQGIDLSDNSTFEIGKQLYVVIYRQEGNNITEAAVYTRISSAVRPSWTVPNAINGPTTPPQYRLSGADTIVFGGVKNSMGPGGFNAATAPTTFDVQTHTLATPIPIAIPEPSSLALTLLAALGLTRRKRSS